MRARTRVRVAGGVAVGIGAAATGLIVAAALGVVGGSVGGYVCFAVVAAVFGVGGVAMLAGSGTMPDNWPPRDDDTR